MSSRNKLPTEVLILIFTLINKSSLLHCQQVCKEWKYPARVVFYKDIKFLNVGQVESFIQSNKLDPSIGKLVKSIDFSPLLINLSLDTMNKSLFINVAKYTPNVERVIANQPTAEFWNLCYFSCLIKYWSHICYLPKSKRDYSEYLRTAMVCQEFLSRLEVVPEYFESRGRHWTELAAVVFKPFKRVESLRFILYSYRDIIYTFDYLLDQFKNITKLNLIYEGVYRRIQGDDHIVLDLSHIKPLKTLERLRIDKGRLNTNTINYLLHKFPNLNRIKLNLGHCHVEYTQSELNSVFNYAMLIPNSVIRLTTYKDLEILSLFVDGINLNSGIALSVNYQGNRHIFGTYESRIELKHSKIIKPMMDKNIAIANEQSHIIIETDRDPFTDIEIYQNNIQNVIGDRLTFLYLDVQGDIQFEDDENPTWLDNTFKYCTTLKTLVFASRYLEESLQINTSICRLTFIGVQFSNEVFSQLSNNLPSLQYLQLIDCELPYDDIIDMPKTCFEQFFMNDASKEIRCINVNILTDTHEHHFKCKRNKDYHITSVKQICIRLKCKSIKSINIEFDGLKIMQYI